LEDPDEDEGDKSRIVEKGFDLREAEGLRFHVRRLGGESA
jgi:hypothetical protein